MTAAPGPDGASTAAAPASRRDETPLGRTRRTRKVVRELGRLHPDATCALHYATPLELLVATVLSAQTTDVRVNQVTPDLFARFPDAAALAAADRAELEDLVRPTGFFRAKAQSLLGLAQALVERHGGEVPRDRQALEALPGVGRKTANVILNTAFGEPTIAVDTHIFRVANRTGLAPGRTVRDVEKALLAMTPVSGTLTSSSFHGSASSTQFSPLE